MRRKPAFVSPATVLAGIALARDFAPGLNGNTTDNDHLTVSAPVIGTGGTAFNTVADGGMATSWFASMYSSGPVARTLNVYVICS